MNVTVTKEANHSRVINCHKYCQTSKDVIVKFTVEKLVSCENYYRSYDQILPEVWIELRKLYLNRSANIDLLNQHLLPLLEKINKGFTKIVQLLDIQLLTKEFVSSKKIIEAPVLLSLNVLFRSSKNAFIPYRTVSFVPELIRRTLYTNNLLFVSQIETNKEKDEN